jgi:hypothetical protein
VPVAKDPGQGSTVLETPVCAKAAAAVWEKQNINAPVEILIAENVATAKAQAPLTGNACQTTENVFVLDGVYAQETSVFVTFTHREKPPA